MKNVQFKNGFTLIELLIVIAIIAVLAVAFLPTLLGAPAKGRDTSRIANLQKIQKVLVNANLEGKKYPNLSGSIVDSALLFVNNNNWTWSNSYATSFGGVIPTDPTSGRFFYYVAKPAGYTFGVWAEVEVLTNGNANCDKVTFAITLGTPVAPVNNVVPCYAILMQ